MQAPTGFAAFLNPFATQPTGQGESSGMGASSGLAGLGEGLFGVEGEDAGQDGAFAGLLNEAMAAVAGVILPLQPQAAPAPKVDGAAAQAALPGGGAATPLLTTDLELAGAEDGVVQPAPEGEGLFASALEAASADGVPADAASRAGAFAKAETVLPATATAVATAVAPSPSASASAPAVAADVAVAVAAQVQTDQQIQTEARTAQPASSPTQPAVAAQAAQAATVVAAAPPAPVKTAAEPVKAAGKDKTAQAEDARAASGSTGFQPSQTARSVQEAVTELAVTPPDAFEGEDAPLAAETPEAPVLQSAATTAEVRPQATLGESARVTTQTVAHLAAQIAQKLDGKTTRFDVQLNPHGLGSVDVRVEIGPRGDITAALSFDNPQAAAELRSRTGELQAALEQAGFDASRTTLSFNSGGQGQQQGLWDQNRQASEGRVWQSRAFTDLSDTPEAAPAPVRRRATSGVDVRI